MNLRSIEEKEELMVDSEKLRQNYKICVDKLDDKLEGFIDANSHWISDDEVSLLYQYNRYLKQNCRR